MATFLVIVPIDGTKLFQVKSLFWFSQVRNHHICDLNPSHVSSHLCCIVLLKSILPMAEMYSDDMSALTFILPSSISFFVIFHTSRSGKYPEMKDLSAHTSHLIFTLRSFEGITSSGQKHQHNSVQLVVGVWNTADTGATLLRPASLSI